MAGWTDYADWTNENTIKIVSGKDLLLPLIRAINERLSVMVQYFPYPPVQVIGEDILLCSLDTIKSSIQTAILLMLPYFINPVRLTNRATQEISYPFDGFTWSHTPVQGHDITYTDILAAIGASEKFNYNEKLTPELWSKWIYQQYQILNKLTKVVRTVSEFNANCQYYERTGTISGGWISDWTIQTSRQYAGLYMPYTLLWDGSHDENFIRDYVADISMTVPDIASLKCNIDLYAPVTNMSGYPYYNELNATQNQLKQFGAFTGKTTGDVLSIPGPIGKIDVIPPGGSAKTWGWGVMQPAGTVIALDFAVDGGFEFIAGS